MGYIPFYVEEDKNTENNNVSFDEKNNTSLNEENNTNPVDISFYQEDLNDSKIIEESSNDESFNNENENDKESINENINNISNNNIPEQNVVDNSAVNNAPTQTAERVIEVDNIGNINNKDIEKIKDAKEVGDIAIQAQIEDLKEEADKIKSEEDKKKETYKQELDKYYSDRNITFDNTDYKYNPIIAAAIIGPEVLSIIPREEFSKYINSPYTDLRDFTDKIEQLKSDKKISDSDYLTIQKNMQDVLLGLNISLDKNDIVTPDDYVRDLAYAFKDLTIANPDAEENKKMAIQKDILPYAPPYAFIRLKKKQPKQEENMIPESPEQYTIYNAPILSSITPIYKQKYIPRSMPLIEFNGKTYGSEFSSIIASSLNYRYSNGQYYKIEDKDIENLKDAGYIFTFDSSIYSHSIDEPFSTNLFHAQSEESIVGNGQMSVSSRDILGTALVNNLDKEKMTWGGRLMTLPESFITTLPHIAESILSHIEGALSLVNIDEEAYFNTLKNRIKDYTNILPTKSMMGDAWSTDSIVSSVSGLIGISLFGRAVGALGTMGADAEGIGLIERQKNMAQVMGWVWALDMSGNAYDEARNAGMTARESGAFGLANLFAMKQASIATSWMVSDPEMASIKTSLKEFVSDGYKGVLNDIKTTGIKGPDGVFMETSKRMFKKVPKIIEKSYNLLKKANNSKLQLVQGIKNNIAFALGMKINEEAVKAVFSTLNRFAGWEQANLGGIADVINGKKDMGTYLLEQGKDFLHSATTFALSGFLEGLPKDIFGKKEINSAKIDSFAKIYLYGLEKQFYKEVEKQYSKIGIAKKTSFEVDNGMLAPSRNEEESIAMGLKKQLLSQYNATKRMLQDVGFQPGMIKLADDVNMFHVNLMDKFSENIKKMFKFYHNYNIYSNVHKDLITAFLKKYGKSTVRKYKWIKKEGEDVIVDLDGIDDYMVDEILGFDEEDKAFTDNIIDDILNQYNEQRASSDNEAKKITREDFIEAFKSLIYTRNISRGNSFVDEYILSTLEDSKIFGNDLNRDKMFKDSKFKALILKYFNAMNEFIINNMKSVDLNKASLEQLKEILKEKGDAVFSGNDLQSINIDDLFYNFIKEKGIEHFPEKMLDEIKEKLLEKIQATILDKAVNNSDSATFLAKEILKKELLSIDFNENIDNIKIFVLGMIWNDFLDKKKKILKNVLSEDKIDYYNIDNIDEITNEEIIKLVNIIRDSISKKEFDILTTTKEDFYGENKRYIHNNVYDESIKELKKEGYASFLNYIEKNYFKTEGNKVIEIKKLENLNDVIENYEDVFSSLIELNAKKLKNKHYNSVKLMFDYFNDLMWKGDLILGGFKKVEDSLRKLAKFKDYFMFNDYILNIKTYNKDDLHKAPITAVFNNTINLNINTGQVNISSSSIKKSLMERLIQAKNGTHVDGDGNEFIKLYDPQGIASDYNSLMYYNGFLMAIFRRYKNLNELSRKIESIQKGNFLDTKKYTNSIFGIMIEWLKKKWTPKGFYVEEYDELIKPGEGNILNFFKRNVMDSQRMSYLLNKKDLTEEEKIELKEYNDAEKAISFKNKDYQDIISFIINKLDNEDNIVITNNGLKDFIDEQNLNNIRDDENSYDDAIKNLTKIFLFISEHTRFDSSIKETKALEILEHIIKDYNMIGSNAVVLTLSIYNYLFIKDKDNKDKITISHDARQYAVVKDIASDLSKNTVVSIFKKTFNNLLEYENNSFNLLKGFINADNKLFYFIENPEKTNNEKFINLRRFINETGMALSKLDHEKVETFFNDLNEYINENNNITYLTSLIYYAYVGYDIEEIWKEYYLNNRIINDEVVPFADQEINIILMMLYDRLSKKEYEDMRKYIGNEKDYKGNKIIRDVYVLDSTFGAGKTTIMTNEFLYNVEKGDHENVGCTLISASIDRKVKDFENTLIKLGEKNKKNKDGEIKHKRIIKSTNISDLINGGEGLDKKLKDIKRVLIDEAHILNESQLDSIINNINNYNKEHDTNIKLYFLGDHSQFAFNDGSANTNSFGDIIYSVLSGMYINDSLRIKTTIQINNLNNIDEIYDPKVSEAKYSINSKFNLKYSVAPVEKDKDGNILRTTMIGTGTSYTTEDDAYKVFKARLNRQYRTSDKDTHLDKIYNFAKMKYKKGENTSIIFAADINIDDKVIGNLKEDIIKYFIEKAKNDGLEEKEVKDLVDSIKVENYSGVDSVTDGFKIAGSESDFTYYYLTGKSKLFEQDDIKLTMSLKSFFKITLTRARIYNDLIVKEGVGLTKEKGEFGSSYDDKQYNILENESFVKSINEFRSVIESMTGEVAEKIKNINEIDKNKLAQLKSETNVDRKFNIALDLLNLFSEEEIFTDENFENIKKDLVSKTDLDEKKKDEIANIIIKFFRTKDKKSIDEMMQKLNEAFNNGEDGDKYFITFMSSFMRLRNVIIQPALYNILGNARISMFRELAGEVDLTILGQIEQDLNDENKKKRMDEKALESLFRIAYMRKISDNDLLIELNRIRSRVEELENDKDNIYGSILGFEIVKANIEDANEKINELNSRKEEIKEKLKKGNEKDKELLSNKLKNIDNEINQLNSKIKENKKYLDDNKESYDEMNEKMKSIDEEREQLLIDFNYDYSIIKARHLLKNKNLAFIKASNEIKNKYREAIRETRGQGEDSLINKLREKGLGFMYINPSRTDSIENHEKKIRESKLFNEQDGLKLISSDIDRMDVTKKLLNNEMSGKLKIFMSRENGDLRAYILLAKDDGYVILNILPADKYSVDEIKSYFKEGEDIVNVDINVNQYKDLISMHTAGKIIKDENSFLSLSEFLEKVKGNKNVKIHKNIVFIDNKANDINNNIVRSGFYLLYAIDEMDPITDIPSESNNVFMPSIFKGENFSKPLNIGFIALDINRKKLIDIFPSVFSTDKKFGEVNAMMTFRTKIAFTAHLYMLMHAIREIYEDNNEGLNLDNKKRDVENYIDEYIKDNDIDITDKIKDKILNYINKDNPSIEELKKRSKLVKKLHNYLSYIFKQSDAKVKDKSAEDIDNEYRSVFSSLTDSGVLNFMSGKDVKKKIKSGEIFTDNDEKEYDDYTYLEFNLFRFIENMDNEKAFKYGISVDENIRNVLSLIDDTLADNKYFVGIKGVENGDYGIKVHINKMKEKLSNSNTIIIGDIDNLKDKFNVNNVKGIGDSSLLIDVKKLQSLTKKEELSTSEPTIKEEEHEETIDSEAEKQEQKAKEEDEKGNFAASDEVKNKLKKIINNAKKEKKDKKSVEEQISNIKENDDYSSENKSIKVATEFMNEYINTLFGEEADSKRQDIETLASYVKATSGTDKDIFKNMLYTLFSKSILNESSTIKMQNYIYEEIPLDLFDEENRNLYKKIVEEITNNCPE